MKKIAPVLALAVALALAAPTWADEQAEGEEPEPGTWSISSELNVTLTQNAYSDNWDGSELGSISWVSGWNTLAESQLSPTFHTSNTAKLSFGQTHSQISTTDSEGAITKRWQRPVKSTDQVDLESVLRLTFGWVVDPFAGLRLESHFLDESDPSKSRSLNPILLTESFGVARVFMKDEEREDRKRRGLRYEDFEEKWLEQRPPEEALEYYGSWPDGM